MFRKVVRAVDEHCFVTAVRVNKMLQKPLCSLIYLKRHDTEFVVLQQCDEIEVDVGPALPQQTIPPVLSAQNTTRGLKKDI